MFPGEIARTLVSDVRIAMFPETVILERCKIIFVSASSCVPDNLSSISLGILPPAAVKT